MSYSFNVRAADKAAACAAVAAELEKVVASQPIHEHDVAQAQAAADAFIDLVGEVAGLELSVSVNGSVYTVDGVFRGASVGVNVGLANPVA